MQNFSGIRLEFHKVTKASKAKTLAMEWTEGEKTLESLTAAFERAIAYGRSQERAAALRRLGAGYKADAFAGGDLTSFEARDVAKALVRGNKEASIK
jgi:hypothetical protein